MKPLLHAPSKSLRRAPKNLSLRRPYICARCLSHSATSQPAPASPPLQKSYAHLPTRRLISLSGPEALHFLQGIITQNTKPKIPRSAPGFFTSFLNAQGRVINDAFIYRFDHGSGTSMSEDGSQEEGEWLVEVDSDEAEKLYKHIRRYKLRSKFKVRLVDEDELKVWSVWDEGSSWTAHSIAGSQSSPSPTGGSVMLPDTRAPGMGHRLVLPGNQKPEVECEESSEVDYRIRRYMKGVAEGQGEILRETALPQESNIDYMGGIDYRKGCYVGQELTIRTHHTGVVRKRVLPVMLYPESESSPTKLEYRALGEGVDASQVAKETSITKAGGKGRSAGKFLVGVGNVGLGLCRLENMTEVVVGGEGAVGKYKDGDEFRVAIGEGGEGLKIKAFVPAWHLNK